MPSAGGYRYLSSLNMAVGSSGGVSNSTTSFSAVTRFVRLCVPGALSATSGVRFVIGESPVADSTSAYLPPNVVEIVPVTPGQKIAVLSNDSILPSINIVQMF